MSDLKFSLSTDEEHVIEIESSLIYAAWCSGCAYGGQTAKFEVSTSFVGNGATIKVKGKSEKGKKLGKINKVIKHNMFIGEFEIPKDIKIGDEIYFRVELPDNDLKGESNRIPVFPPIEVSNMKWSAEEGRRGDILTLSADIKGVQSGAEVDVTIYEYDSDKVHDKISALAAFVEDGKMELQWGYEYHEDTDEIPTEEELEKYGAKYNPPEYFFTITIGGEEYGKEQESGILKFKDWIEISLCDSGGKRMANEKYVLHMPDGTKREGTLDGEGRAREKDIPPGVVYQEFPNFPEATVSGGGD